MSVEGGEIDRAIPILRASRLSQIVNGLELKDVQNIQRSPLRSNKKSILCKKDKNFKKRKVGYFFYCSWQ